jgi:PPOX class probable F420-dependent enzyme
MPQVDPPPDAVGVPASHADLLERPLSVVLTTEMRDGRLQSTVVWFSFDGRDVLVNTMREFRKARNLRARPRATVLILEPADEGRWIEIRGSVTLDEGGAMEHLDGLARTYCGADRYFGVEHPILCRLHPSRVTTGPGRVSNASPARAPNAHRSARRPCADEPAIPASHRDLFERPLLAALSTSLPSGAQTHPTWFELEGNDVLVNTTRERAKGRSLERDPRATVLIVDPADTVRWIEIRGDVDLQEEGAVEQLDRLTRRYTTHPAFYGHVYPLGQRELETRIVARIHPRRINIDAIHG